MNLRHRNLGIVVLALLAACGGFSQEVSINGITMRLTASWDGVHMAYTIERNGTTGLFVVNDDWLGCTRLDALATRQYAWSPDGSRLAYVTRDPASGQYSLHTVRANGSDRRQITGGWNLVGRPVWSPDSARLAFTTSGFAGHGALTTAPAGGGGVVDVDTNGVFMDIVWSPDSARIAYRAGASIFAAFQLRSAAADGSAGFVVSGAGDVRSGGIAWCQDGARLLYRADEELAGVVALYSAGFDGTGRRRLSGDLDAGREVAGGFACSPDGAFVAFGMVRHADDVMELYTTSWDGAPYLVTEHVARFVDVPVFAWSPDGLWLAFRTTSGRLFTFDPVDRTLVGIDTGVEPGFTWSPDGQHLAYLAGGWLYAARADGASSMPIARSEPGFVWSPGADALLFVDGGLYTGRIRDGLVSLVADLDGIGELAWLRDANRIVFVARGADGAVGLYRAGPFGGAVRIACGE